MADRSAGADSHHGAHNATMKHNVALHSLVLPPQLHSPQSTVSVIHQLGARPLGRCSLARFRFQNVKETPSSRAVGV